jgi:arylsulfatase A-like enzyme
MELSHSLRTERFTYIAWPDGATQLYDDEHDPKQYINLADDPQQTATIAEMKQRLIDGWRGALPPK